MYRNNSGKNCEKYSPYQYHGEEGSDLELKLINVRMYAIA